MEIISVRTALFVPWCAGAAPGPAEVSFTFFLFFLSRTLDTNHMVAVGDEGMRTNGNRSEPHSWINTGYEGVDFQCNLESSAVDVSVLAG